MSETSDTLISAVANRRTIYSLSNESSISESRLKEVVTQVLLATPSAFNTQSTRIVTLLGIHHQRLWDIVKTALKPLVPDDQWHNTETKLGGFKASYGTILFFEDPTTYDALQSFKMYADKFESWRDQTNGMHQLLIWTAIEAEGMGASVQHYNPLIDDEVKKVFEIDPSWVLLTQMVIGKPVGEKPAAKPKKPVQERLRMIV